LSVFDITRHCVVSCLPDIADEKLYLTRTSLKKIVSHWIMSLMWDPNVGFANLMAQVYK
jgi:hypothetical protein